MKASTENPNITCCARRHMPPTIFVTYDAICACVSMNSPDKNPPFEFWASEYHLANLNNRSVATESSALDWLQDHGWLINTLTLEEQRRFRGRLDTNRFRVLSHDEYVAMEHHAGSCPPKKYEKTAGDQWKAANPGETPLHIRKLNIARTLRAFAAKWSAVVAKYESRIVTEPSVTVNAASVVTEPFVTEIPPSQNPLCRTVTEPSVSSVTEPSVTTVTESSVISLTPSGSVQQKQTEAEPQDPRPQQKAGDQGRCDLGDLGDSCVADALLKNLGLVVPDPTGIKSKAFRKFWAELTNHEELPGGLRRAGRWPKGKTAILEFFLKGVSVRSLVEAANDWDGDRQQRIETFPGDRWVQFVTEARQDIEDAHESEQYDKRKAAEKSRK